MQPVHGNQYNSILGQGARIFTNNNQLPQVQAQPPTDLVQERINQLERAFKLLKEERNKDKFDDSDEELKPFAPHISNTLFPYRIKIPHVAPFDETSDLYRHLSTFHTIMCVSNVRYELRCMLFPTTLTGPMKNWFDKF